MNREVRLNRFKGRNALSQHSKCARYAPNGIVNFRRTIERNNQFIGVLNNRPCMPRYEKSGA